MKKRPTLEKINKNIELIKKTIEETKYFINNPTKTKTKRSVLEFGLRISNYKLKELEIMKEIKEAGKKVRAEING